MGFDYTIMLDDLAAVSSITSGSNIKIDDINILLTTLTDVYVTILENGLTAVEAGDIQFRSEHTKKFFNAGLTGLKNAKVPSTIKFLLDFLLLQASREKDISKAELFEMHLLTNILPYLLPEGDCIKKFIDYLVEFCTDEGQYYQIAKFVKYIDTYKIADCHVLETARSFESTTSS
jgi:hypothetical protein